MTMAEDWSKIDRDWAKLEMKLKVYGLAQAKKLFAIVTARDKLLDQHEKAFRAALQGAIKAGVKGDTLKELSAHKPVVAAQSDLDADCREITTEVKTLSTFCKECEVVADAVEKLSDAMAKLLKSSGGKPPPAKAKMVDKVETTRKELHEAATFRFKVDKFLVAFPKQYPAWLKHVVEKELEKGSGEAEKQREKEADKEGFGAEAFEDRAAEIEALGKKVAKALASAREEMKEDLRKAAQKVKEANTDVTRMRKLLAEAKAQRDKFKKDIALLKDAKKILKLVDGLAEIVTEADGELKKVGTELKRAVADK